MKAALCDGPNTPAPGAESTEHDEVRKAIATIKRIMAKLEDLIANLAIAAGRKDVLMQEVQRLLAVITDRMLAVNPATASPEANPTQKIQVSGVTQLILEVDQSPGGDVASLSKKQDTQNNENN